MKQQQFKSASSSLCPNIRLLFCLTIPLLLLLHQRVTALKASMNYVPEGNNPLLYQPGVDHLTHLDQSTFADTVFEAGRTNAFVVEFYADWCGHCRAFAPHYRHFASLTKRWSEVVKVGAVNCADTYNSQICRANGVGYFPLIKYYPRTASGYGDGIFLEAAHSGESLRDQLAGKVLNEFNRFGYADWPNLRYLDVNAQTQFEDLWTGVSPSANFLLILFEQPTDPIGVQAVLDLWPHREVVGVRRAMANSALVPMLGISKFPYAALFKRGDQQSIFMDPFHGQATLDEVLQRTGPGRFVVALDAPAHQQTNAVASNETPTEPPKVELVDCEQFPERCKELYFASEVDMLKSMRMALLDEVTRVDGLIQGDRFRHLYGFVNALYEHFPTKTFDAGGRGETIRRRMMKRAIAAVNTRLERSERAKMVFGQMKQLLETKPAAISVEEWRNQFENVERVYGFPFAQNASWQHCAGSSPEFRGYTCGLWHTFHSLTVHAFIDSMQSGIPLNPLAPLRAIQGWVMEFFGCEHCRRHFMRMTTEKYPMDERRVARLHDMPMYLWRAHNIVNARLHKHITEDPQFPKYQFPPPFLCPTCHSGGLFSRRQTMNFLLRYYGSIRPARRILDGEMMETVARRGTRKIAH